MARQRTPLLVLGLGNLLARDDGLGVAALALLARRWRAPEGVRLLDGGTQGLQLWPWIDAADRLILVDAVRIEEPAGTLVRLEGPDEVLHCVADRLGLQDAPDARMPASLVLLGIVPEQIDLGLDRSPTVETSLPALVDLIVAEASGMGFRFAPLPDFTPVQSALQEMR
ncbi:MAG: hydrogenase maturation protease [Myxococcales bacterium]